MTPALVAQNAPTRSVAQTGSKTPDISGKWQFAFQTDGGPRTNEAELKQDGKEITGTWNKTVPVKGTLSEGKLDLEFPITSEEAGEGTLRIIGRLTDVLTGSWSFQSYSGTFKATRVTP